MEPTAASTSSTESRYVALGRVVGAHGLRGQLRVRYFGDGPDELLRHDGLVLGTSEDDAGAVTFRVARAVPGRAGEVRMGLVGVTRREAADELCGRLVMTTPDQLEPLAAGESPMHWQRRISRLLAVPPHRVPVLRRPLPRAASPCPTELLVPRPRYAARRLRRGVAPSAAL